MRTVSTWEPEPPDDRKKKPPSPADLIRQSVAEATEMGKRNGWGRVVSDKYMDLSTGACVVLTFESGAQVRVGMPPGSRS
jgi:hypothetical protein